MSKTWKTVRAVVEMPVRGDFTEKDFVDNVQAVLSFSGRLKVVVGAAPGVQDVGTLRVKSYGRVEAKKKMTKTVLRQL